jgi:hypothetical protein
MKTEITLIITLVKIVLLKLLIPKTNAVVVGIIKKDETKRIPTIFMEVTMAKAHIITSIWLSHLTGIPLACAVSSSNVM